MADPALTPEQYVAQGGEACPSCGDTRFAEYIQGFRHKVAMEVADTNRLTRLVFCGECRATWLDEVVRTGYSALAMGGKGGNQQ